MSIPRFDTAGTTVYFGTVITGTASSDTFCHPYALDTSATAPATPPGRVDSLDISMNPDGTSLDLSWTPSCSGAATSATIVPSSSLTFYLIVPRSGNVQGSYGLDLNGSERPRRSAAASGEGPGFVRVVVVTSVNLSPPSGPPGSRVLDRSLLPGPSSASMVARKAGRMVVCRRIFRPGSL